MTEKRKDYISWDEYFMGVAMLSGMRSKDPSTQVGCCIVSQDNKILSMGIMVSRSGARTMSSLGKGKAMIRWRQNICTQPTVS